MMRFQKCVDTVFAAFGYIVLTVAVISLWVYGVELKGLPVIVPGIGLGLGTALAIWLYTLMGKAERFFAANDPEKYFRRIMLIGAAVLLLFEILTAVFCEIEKLNDLRYVKTAAENLLMKGPDYLHEGLPERHSEYFYVYPNNHTILIMIYWMDKLEYTLTGAVRGVVPIVFNIIGMNLSYILACKSARLIYSPEKAAVCCIRGLMFTPLISYAAIYYTDTLAMPWLTAAVYLYLKQRALPDDDKCRYLLLAGSAVSLGIAFRIKTTPVIFLIAVVIDMLIRRRPVKKLLTELAALLCCFAVTAFLISTVTQSILRLDRQKLEECRFPPVHWVMMSSDGIGNYNVDDFMYTKSFKGYDAKVKADIDRLGEKLSEQGVLGMTLHFLNKAAYTWRDAAYMAGYYMTGFFRGPIWHGLSFLFNFTLLITIQQRFNEAACTDAKASSKSFVLRLCFVGIAIFLLLWEARSRYLICFFILYALI